MSWPAPSRPAATSRSRLLRWVQQESVGTGGDSVGVSGRLPAADPLPDQHGSRRARSERVGGGEDPDRVQHHRPPARHRGPAGPGPGRGAAEADGEPPAECGPARAADSDDLHQQPTEQLRLLENRLSLSSFATAK